MSPNGIATSQLRQLIYYHLDNDMLDNANFLAGRLHALEPRNPDSSHLLALTYYRLRRFKAAYDFSQKYGANGRHLGCAYVFAQACLELGRNTDGVTALEKCRSAWAGKNHWNQHSENSRRHTPDASAALTLLAKLWRAHGDSGKSGDLFIEVHKQNPFVWDAFEGLCKIGADLKTENMFRPTMQLPGTAEAGNGETQIYVDEDSRQPQVLQAKSGLHMSMDNPFTSTAPEQHDSLDHKLRGKSTLGQAMKSTATEWDTPTASGGLLDDDTAMGGISAENDDTFFEPPAAPPRRSRMGMHLEGPDRLRPHASRTNPATMSTASEGMSDDPLQAPRKATAVGQKRNVSGQAAQSSLDSSSQPRRSNRLFTQTTTSTRSTRSTMDTAASIAGRADRVARQAKTATGTRGRTGAIVGRVVSGNTKRLPPDEKEKRPTGRMGEKNAGLTSGPMITSAVLQKQSQLTSHSSRSDEQEAMSSLLNNFRQLAVGCHAIASFDMPTAISMFRALPAAQRETPWVLAQLGKAHYEAGSFRLAEDCFARLIKIQPSRIEDMDMYSTVLWHLKKDTTLAYLCRVLQDHDSDAPQTWVAVGNAFSLAREHDQAISAFKRATQLDPKFAYAYTLMGHEYIANEAFDNALASFRQSVSVDRRGYGGWYGLGKVFQCMGKLDDAERHFRVAASINPSNATLLVCIGVVLERLRNKKGALANYTRALDLDPSSALARFKKARVLMHLKQYDQALGELEILRDQAPDEANVWFLLGKCYKGTNERGEALRAFTTALNLDVKAAPFIKEAMEALDEEDEESDDD